jgi:hypothetical protein
VELSWKTNAGARFAGFNLYREPSRGDGAKAKLNAELIIGRSPYGFRDADVEPGERYRYWLEAVALNGQRETVGPVEGEAGSRVYAFALAQNAPNPARATTTFAFSVPAACDATITIYDLAGRRVMTPFAGSARPGENEVAVHVSAAAAARRMVVVR